MSAAEVSTDRRTNCDPVKLTIDDPMRAGVHSLWEQDLFVDYKIQVENQEFQVHKVILASMSDYFRAMLSGGLAESESDKVVIKGVKATAVEILIKFIYTSHLDITPENVSDVLAGAMYFQIKPAIQMCSQFMINKLDLENWYDLLTLFRSYNLTKEIKTVQAFVIRHMRAIGRTSNHTKLPYEDFFFLVQNWQSFEVELILFIMQWVYADIPRSIHYDDLLCSMRLSLMTPTELSLLKTNAKESFPTTESWNALFNKALDYHKLPIRHRVLHNSDQSKVRSPPSFVTFSRRDAERGGYFYEPHEQNSFMEYADLKIPDMFGEIGQGFPDPEGFGCYTWYQQIEVNNFLVVSVIDDTRLAMGGERTEQWYIFDPRTIQWEKMANLAKGVSNPTLVHDGKHIYAVGGDFFQSDYHDEDDKIEKYDFESDTWSTFSTLVVEVQAYAVSICNGGLYVSGGVVKEEDDSDDSDASPAYIRQKRMDCLDLTTGEWESKAQMLKRRSGHSMHAMKIYGEEGLLLIRNSDKVNKPPDIEFYSPSKDEWVRCEFIFDGKLPNMNRHSWVRGNSVFVSDNDTRRGFFTANKHCAVVTFPEEGNEASVEYLVEYRKRFRESALHTVLSITPISVQSLLESV